MRLSGCETEIHTRRITLSVVVCDLYTRLCTQKSDVCIIEKVYYAELTSSSSLDMYYVVYICTTIKRNIHNCRFYARFI